MIRRVSLLILFGWMSFFAFADITIMSYNVENFFNPAVDSLNPDRDYTPSGLRHWSYARFHHKAEQIARVIASVEENAFPEVVVLNEVEDSTCLALLCHKMPNYPYRFIHFDSHDNRGIDVAILYDSIRVSPISSIPVTVSLPNAVTRDILYATLLVDKRDTLHVLACHLPSQLGGYSTSQWKRETAKSIMRHLTDSILLGSPATHIVICGDINMPPKDDILHLHNLMTMPAGTHKFEGTWTCLDQFYVSESLLPVSCARIFDVDWLQEEDRKYLSVRPKRTFNGFRYNKNGFSDHLPILLIIHF